VDPGADDPAAFAHRPERAGYHRAPRTARYGRVGARDARDAALATLAARTTSQIVQRIGHVGVFYRRRAQLPNILLPDN